MDTRRIASICLAAGLVAFSGCSKDAVNRNRENSFLTSVDLQSMTDQMAHSIAADDRIARLTATKPMIIVMKPIQNETNEIIRKGEKELYVHRVRVLLSNNAELRSRFVFVLNRDDYEKLQSEENLNPSELGTPETRVQPEYALTGTFYADTHVSNKGRSDTYLCTYRLTNLSTGVQVWEGKYETVKRVKKEFLD